MIERLLFDGVDAEPAGAPVGGENNLVPFACPYEAHSPLSLPELAIARAHVALDATIVQKVPILGRDGVIHRRFPGLIDGSRATCQPIG